MTRRYSIAAGICLTLLLFTGTAVYSSGLETADYQTRFTHINTFENTFDISSEGEANITSYINVRNAESVKIAANLQQYKSGSWKTVKSWSKSKDGTSCSAGGKWYVPSGYKYRMVSYGYVYEDGNMVESTSYTSKVKVY